MDEKIKKLILDELNVLESDRLFADDREGYWTAYGMQEGIISVLRIMGYKVVRKSSNVHGDDYIMYLGIEKR